MVGWAAKIKGIPGIKDAAQANGSRRGGSPQGMKFEDSGAPIGRVLLQLKGGLSAPRIALK